MRLIWISALGLIGAVVSLFQTKHFNDLRNGTGGFRSICSVGPFDCEAIDSSRYAELFAGIPISALALSAFLLIAAIAWTGRRPFWKREAIRALFLLSSLSVLFCASYLVIQFAVLHKACLYCLSVDLICFTIFGLTLSLRPEWIRPHVPMRSHWMAFGWMGLFSVAVAGITHATLASSSGPGLTSNEKQEMVREILESPVLPVDLEGSVRVGPPTAPVVIVKFSDFQCPSCRRGALLLHPLMKRFPKSVQMVFKHFPLDMQCNRFIEQPMHPWSCLASKASECFRKKGQFEVAYHAFFENQELLSAAWLDGFAKDHGWNLDEFHSCLEDPAILERIKKDIEQANILKVNSTPTFFVNGHRQLGALPLDAWTSLIEKLLP